MITIRHITCLNEQGKRSNIEDAVYPPCGTVNETDRLFLVCDGVGGESKGEEASRIAVEGFSNYFIKNQESITDDAAAYLQDAQEYVIGQMQQYIDIYNDAARMSTTLTLAYLLDNKILAAWCGDSRIYHFRNGEILWRSADHSLVAKLVEQGEITEQEAEHHHQKNVILRSISAVGSPATIDTHWLTDIQSGDYLLLCTDGVLEQMNTNRWRNLLTNNDPEKKRQILSHCEGHTNDNFSLYLLQLANDATPAKQTSAQNKKPIIIGLLVLALVIMTFGYWLGQRAKPANPAVQKPINTGTVIANPKNPSASSKLVVPVFNSKKTDTTDNKH